MFFQRCALIGAFPVLLAAMPTAAQDILSLGEAERLALERAPGLERARTTVSASRERVVYEGRLPDPQLTTGFVNVPTDTYSLRQDDMTMTMVGVRQSFPPGDTLNLRSRRAQKELTREEARLETERRQLLRQVRQTWLEIHFQEKSLQLLQAVRRLQEKQLEAAEGRYRAAGDMPQAVPRARQALARVNEREPMVKAQIARARAQLARWVGDAAALPLPAELPALPAVARDFDAARHPELQATEAMHNAARLDVDMVRQEYKPGWMLDLSYGSRRPMPDGTRRPDMVTAMVTFDLPLFRSKRQDRRLAEKQALENGARLETEDKRRELAALHQSARAEYEALAARAKIFEDQLLPAIRRETQTTVAGFARDQTETREAQMKALEAEQEYARLRADLAKTQAELLYLTGE